MIQYELTLTLLSDAEPGTGLGTETLNSTVPRDSRGLPYIPASHIKGLLRDRIEFLRSLRDWDGGVVADLLGEGGADGEEGTLSTLRVGDARLPRTVPSPDDPVITIARTAIGELGTVHGGSLRTSEAIRCGLELESRAALDAEPDGALDLLVRLGLMAIEAVGGGRNRGAGRCRIEIAGERRLPGQLLAALEPALARDTARPATHRVPAAVRELAPGTPVWLRLRFDAESAICCPEVPSGSNTIRSGPVIPASAVQGALLTRLDQLDHGLASACFADSRFRAWPLVPVARTDEPTEQIPFGVRVDLAHRMSKLPEPVTNGNGSTEGSHVFADVAVDPGHWSTLRPGSSLKSSDGILIRSADGLVRLWRAQDLPRMFQAHAVHHDPTGDQRRNLFTVETLAPMVFSGVVALPEAAAQLLLDALSKDPWVNLGKARSVRGGGRLVAERVSRNSSPFENWILPANATGRVFVVQSPLAIPDDWSVDHADQVLGRLAKEAGWGTAVLQETHGGRDVARTQATCGVKFGWNRLGLGPTVGKHNRLRACRVILPGSVLVLEKPLAAATDQLVRGLGDGREQGYGALLPHPGIAVDRVGHLLPEGAVPVLRSRDRAGKLAVQLWQAAGAQKGPSASQIAAVMQKLEIDPARAGEFLAGQKQGRVATRNIWRGVHELLSRAVESAARDDKQRVELLRAMRAWQDLAVANRASEDQ